MEIEKLKISDSYKIAEIHAKSFRGFFLTSLGEKFLIKFYNSLIKDHNNICLGLKENNEVIAFVIGVKNNKSFYRKLFLKNISQLLPQLIKKFLTRPWLFIQLLVSYFSVNKIKLEAEFESCLLSICIDPAFSNKGLGSILIREYELVLIENKVVKYYLTTDSINNDATNKFYIKNKFQLSSVFFQGERKMNVYIKEIL